MNLILFLIASATPASWSQALYPVTGNCYVISTTSNKLVFQKLRQVHGESNYDCDDAFEQLQKDCDNAVAAALKQGQSLVGTSGSVYKDIRIDHKAGSSSYRTVTAQVHEKYKNTDFGADHFKKGIWGINARGESHYFNHTKLKLNYTSVAHEGSETFDTSVTYEPVKCTPDENFRSRQEKIKSSQDKDFG